MDAGSEGSGGCETIVVVRELDFSVEESDVGERSRPGTDKKVAETDAEETAMSKRPLLYDFTWTTAGSFDVSSVCRVIIRS